MSFDSDLTVAACCEWIETMKVTIVTSAISTENKPKISLFEQNLELFIMSKKIGSILVGKRRIKFFFNH